MRAVVHSVSDGVAGLLKLDLPVDADHVHVPCRGRAELAPALRTVTGDRT
jgi:hypothetical protein